LKLELRRIPGKDNLLGGVIYHKLDPNYVEKALTNELREQMRALDIMDRLFATSPKWKLPNAMGLLHTLGHKRLRLAKEAINTIYFDSENGD